MSLISGISRELPVLIAGPTASGKSALAMELAARDGRMVVNADALQVYANWRILTARPSTQDEAAIPHALYGHVPREIGYSVGAWLRDLTPLLASRVVIVGGTGLYLSALTDGLADIPAIPADIRTQANQLLASAGPDAMLSDLDARTLARLDQRNPVRIQRAWEVLQATGRGLADWQADTGPAILPTGAAERLVLQPEPSVLNDRIAHRFHAMIQQGALDEVRAEIAHWDPLRPSSKAIGVKELMSHLQGLTSLETAIELGITATRQYARAQRKWLRQRMVNWTPIGP